MTPTFDVPNFTRPPADVIGAHQHDLLVDPGSAEAIPQLVDPAQRPVDEPVDEPLVPIRHRRIRTLANYWHGGWNHAVPETRLRFGAAAALNRVADALPPRWGLAVFDAWRPLALQVELYEAALASPDAVDGFMAAPSDDPSTPPPHLTGGAVDLTLTFDGTPLALGTGFDDTTERAFVDALEPTDTIDRTLRRRLFHRMVAAGFVVYPGEWWHYELGTRRWAAVTGERARYDAITPSGFRRS